MKILITGFSGHIGSFLYRNFCNDKKIKKIFLIDNFENNKINILFTKKKNQNVFLNTVIFQKRIR